MFTVTDVAFIGESQASNKILKPWWDVLMDYLVFSMLMLSIFSGTLLLLKDAVACVPMDFPERGNSVPTAASTQNSESTPSHLDPTAQAHTIFASTSEPSFIPETVRGRPTKLDYQQYVYINQVCYQKAVPWYSKYFPYLALMHSLVLLVSNNFWFRYPKTSSKIEHFVSILGKCFESPWTTKALSETACEDSESNPNRLNVSIPKHSDTEAKEGIDIPLVPNPEASFEKPVFEVPSVTILDKTDGEQAKALFEKVRKFRAHIEETDFTYKFYVGQAVFKVVKFLVVLSYTCTIVDHIQFFYICKPKIRNLTGYSKFYCTHNLAFVISKLLITYMILIIIYGLLSIYNLFWLFQGSLKEYSFEKVREESSFSDIPDVKNDFAFLLHMADQYDKLYSKRFAVFLSEVSENKLLEVNLNYEWTYEKLRQHVLRNSNGKLELHLFMLSGVPKSVFDMSDLEVLKLELISDVKLPAKVSQMTSLKELYLYHCPARVEHIALNFLRENLDVLHVKFTDTGEIPLWIYSLKNLTELYLSGNLNSENNKLIALESMKELKHLKLLNFKSNFSKIPSNVVDVATHLSKLVIQNDGTKLTVLNNLKKLSNLSELELQSCYLERIPQALSSLTNLQKIDLKSNNIRTMEEVSGFQSLRRLTCLRLWHNIIVSIPNTINVLRNLEQLFLSNNRLESLPNALFDLHKLRHLDVSYNLISLLPKNIEQLENLQSFSISDNKVDLLPLQLFNCVKLKTLQLGNNRITVVPAEIEQLTQLTYLELKGNYLVKLPPELGSCCFLKKHSFIVEDALFESLPFEVQEMLTEPEFVSSS
ncbi:volume-regulated anion channel subunit LRRC8D-like [Latimeria chalumnae]|uniref:Si:ch211-106h11.1 n=1 Tax=Latimeria chalumnae TaxID=7897 RepID=H3AZN8_LATCH|nr:PREDICTED: volume-regulated anion channel subunit LRRC8D-like [Latimeria chalumnae]|eukprot:XP_014347654.1 PREDICTED: volume-regulated anion channel subunit LRRC8D-like [Latimeria chalumnae]